MVERMRARPLARPIHLAFSYDEEVGCIGGRGLAEHLAQKSMRPQACFVGEPTEMGVIIGHKGKRSLRVEVRGLTCHSSLAPHGVNAVEWAARLVAELQRMARRLAAEGRRDPLYDVPYSTVHVGVLRGGTALNIVPDYAEILLEVRAVGGDDPDALVNEITAYAREALEPDMQAVDPHAGFDFGMIAGFPGLDMAPDHALVTLAKSLAGRGDHAKVAFGTEAGLFQQIAGVPTVVIGPGSIDQAHKADEWIDIAQLEHCARFIDGLIDRCRAV
jgi:acetylornithine deacetylase